MKYQKIPALTGLELIKLLKKDGWTEHRQAAHGIALIKRFEDRTSVTIVAKTKGHLPVFFFCDNCSKVHGHDLSPRKNIFQRDVCSQINEHPI